MKKGTVEPRSKRAFERSEFAPRRMPLVAAGIAALTVGAAALYLGVPDFGVRGAGPGFVSVDGAAQRIVPGTDVSTDLSTADPARTDSASTDSARIAPTAQAPRVWLSSLAAPPPTRFASPQFATDPVLPRVNRVLPPLPERAAPEQAERPQTERPQTDRPQTDRQQTAPRQSASEPTEPRIAARIEPQPLPQPGTARPAPDSMTETASESGSATLRSSPGALAIPAATTEQATGAAGALASMRAPTRSPRPVLRPQRTAPAPSNAAMTLALARSRTPLRRPAMATRLASLEVNTATNLRAVPSSSARAAPQPLEVPPLSRALAGSNPCSASALTRAIPRRGRAQGGSQVVAQLPAAGGRARDALVTDQILAGNIPDFLRHLVPVSFAGPGPNGGQTQVVICVMPDYLAVGSDRDFVRVPMGLPAATRVAERFDMVLPTTRMVDAIYRQAAVHLAPAPMQPGPQMSTTGYFSRHNQTVQQQLVAAHAHLGQLIAGHQKDLVLTNRLERNPGRVAIYGWHRRNGSAIQPLSTVHGAQYADYSHGIRLVSRRAFINGRAVDLRDLLSNSRYAGLISSEGTITNRTLLASR